jgi:recombination protein RecT
MATSKRRKRKKGSMSNDLVLLETQLRPLLPKLQQALADRMPAERLMRTIMVSCEKTPKLLECSRQSLFSSAMTAAFLGLEVDGVTGQGYLVPYNDKRLGLIAQFQTGYCGLNTLGARSGYSINADVVREKDDFEYMKGTGAYLRHKINMAEEGRIICAWAVAESKTLPALIEVLRLSDLEAVREKSQAANKGDGFSPWADPKVGRPAMYAKTCRRRLRRSMPMNALTRDYHLAARIDEAWEEQGLSSAISEDGQLIVDGRTESPFPPAQASETPPMQEIIGPKPDAEIERWKRELLEAAEGGLAPVSALWERLGKTSPRLQHALRQFKDKTIKPLAEQAETATTS